MLNQWFQLFHLFRSCILNAARTTVRMLESLIRLAQGTLPSISNYPTSASFLSPLQVWLCIESFPAHARLMFRNEVTQLDAVTAILCIESSMTTSAIVDSVGNALHSNFAENPDQECILSQCLCMHNHHVGMHASNLNKLCLCGT